MLAYSIERYLPTKSNIVTLECADRGYVYAGLKAYSSGIILSQNKEFNDADKLMELTKPKNVFRRKSIDELYEKLPSPLKPLAYLMYQTKEDYKGFSEQIGALNIILQTVHPTYWFQTPKEQRIDLSFGASIKAEYKYDWKVFFDSCIKYEELINPKEDTEKHPIFVINASTMEMMPQTNFPQSSNNTDFAFTPKNVMFDGNGNASIEIDFDSLPDVEDEALSNEADVISKTEKELTKENKPAEIDPVDEAYRKLLE